MTRRGAGAFPVIDNAADLDAGCLALRRRCVAMRRVHDRVGAPPLRRLPADFAGLAQIVVAQQVSAASAAAIWARTTALVRPFRPAALLAKSDDELRSAGLSAGKIRTLRSTAGAISSRQLSLARLASAPEPEIEAELTAIKGIGPWTAGLYTMFCLGRADAWASGDLALQLAAASALELDAKPCPAALEEIAERWRPWRGVAARLLWAWYALPATRPAA